MENKLTDISYIQSLCARNGFELSKNFGQNFIINAGICPKIVYEAEVDEQYGVIEIGPGIGVLTRELAKYAKKVVAIEIDERLPALLAETLEGYDNVKIIMGDVLKLDLAQIIKDEFEGMPVMVCANLPYYITSPIVMKLLEDRLPIESITVMVQKEAAERICAKPATRAAGAISLAVSYYSDPKILFTVSPGSFFPAPKVTSAVIKLDIHKDSPVKPNNPKRMFTVIRAAFSQRRKTAVNGISAGAGVSKENIKIALESLELSPMVRPEQMTLQDFANLSDII